MNTQGWKRVSLPLTPETVRTLAAGDRVLLTGELLTGRDAAHKNLVDLLRAGKPLPVDLRNQTIYYVGPCPASKGYAVGSAGPTTSARVDPLTPELLEAGLRGMVGKGNRSPAVIDAMKKYGAVYFAAVGGAGALLAARIEKSEVLAFPELGTEAVHRFTVRGFPVLVAIDCQGNTIYG